MAKKKELQNKIAVYQIKNGALEISIDASRETLLLTQQQVADIFDVQKAAISKHVKNIFESGELSKRATVSILETVQKEGGRHIARDIEYYNLDLVLSIGYRVNSVKATKFRQWATKTLRSYIVDSESILELIALFSDTWLSLEAYDTNRLETKGVTKKIVKLTADQLSDTLASLKTELIKKGEATDLFGSERQRNSVEGIVGNVMQSFGGKPVYATVEERAAYLFYFIVKNHPFVDGNKRSGAYAFVWYLQKAGVLNTARMTPPALTALTLFVAESESKNKERMIGLILQVLRSGK